MSVKFKVLFVAVFFWRVYAQSSEDGSQSDYEENEKRICHSPGSNMNTVFHTNDDKFPVSVNTIAQYNCTDENMTISPNSTRECLFNGSWSGKLPICARRLPENLNNTVTFLHHDRTENCSLLNLDKCSFQSNVTLQIYLYGDAVVDALEIKACELLDVEVEGGSQTENSITEEIDLTTKRIWYSQPLNVTSIMEIRIIYLQSTSCTITSLNILSQAGQSPSWCPKLSYIEKVIPAGEICIHFAGGTERKKFNESNELCKGGQKNGTLIQPLNNNLQSLLEDNVNATNRYYWIGLYNDNWLTGENLTTTFWGKEDANSEHCVALSNGMMYKWEQRKCSNKNKWICQTGYAACGYPDTKPITLMNITRMDNNSFPLEVLYFCPEGFTLFGTEVRSCQENGLWSEEAPFCERNTEQPTIMNTTSTIDKVFDSEDQDQQTNAIMNTTSTIDKVFDIEDQDQKTNVYIITAAGSVIAVILIAAGALLIWKMKKNTNKPNENKCIEETPSFDSETMVSTEELYEEISLERNIHVKLDAGYESTYGYESIDDIPSTMYSMTKDPTLSEDDVSAFEGIKRLPLPTLAEERNSHLEDQNNDNIELKTYPDIEIIEKKDFVMVDNELYEGSDISNTIETN